MGTLVSSINKTGYHDVTEIYLLKVVLNTIDQSLSLLGKNEKKTTTKNKTFAKYLPTEKVFFECVIYKLEMVYLLVSTIITLSGHCKKSVQKVLLFHVE